MPLVHMAKDIRLASDVTSVGGREGAAEGAREGLKEGDRLGCKLEATDGRRVGS